LTIPPPEKGRDLKRELRLIAAEFGAVLRKLSRYLPIAGYFYYWERKKGLRHLLRMVALSVLSVSVLALAAEVGAELLGGHRISAILAGLKNGWPLKTLFGLSVVVILFHHRAEMSHRESDYVLGEKVWEFSAGRAYLTSKAAIAAALPSFFRVFRRSGIRHVSIFREVSAELLIDRGDVYPDEDDPSYFVRLGKGEGVAGLVHGDMLARYVPRLFFPVNRRAPFSFFFPHAMKFEIARIDGALDLVNPEMDLYIFKAGEKNRIPYKAFLSVPLKCLSPQDNSQRCLGVLNFDFARTDPLGLAEIKTAVFLGQLLADELGRVSTATGENDGKA